MNEWIIIVYDYNFHQNQNNQNLKRLLCNLFCMCVFSAVSFFLSFLSMRRQKGFIIWIYLTTTGFRKLSLPRKKRKHFFLNNLNTYIIPIIGPISHERTRSVVPTQANSGLGTFTHTIELLHRLYIAYTTLNYSSRLPLPGLYRRVELVMRVTNIDSQYFMPPNSVMWNVGVMEFPNYSAFALRQELGLRRDWLGCGKYIRFLLWLSSQNIASLTKQS